MGRRYERAFGTDWDDLPTDEVIRRAYALGVSETLGGELEGEFDRLQEAVDAAHDRDIVELAYREGRTEALDLEPRTDDEDDVWDDLVETEEAEDRELTRVELPDGLPRSLGRIDLLDPPEDDLDVVRLPEFLRRD